MTAWFSSVPARLAVLAAKILDRVVEVVRFLFGPGGVCSRLSFAQIKPVLRHICNHWDYLKHFDRNRRKEY